MPLSPCIYDPINRELRTVPDFFNNGKVYTGFLRAYDVNVGTRIVPGKKLGSLHWDDGSSVSLVVPDECHGTIAAFGGIREHRIHHRPSQVLLILH